MAHHRLAPTRLDPGWELTVNGRHLGGHIEFSADRDTDIECAMAWAEGVLGASESLVWLHVMTDPTRRIDHWEVER